MGDAVASTIPGVAYAEQYPNTRSKFACERLRVKYARVVVVATGNNAGAGKGVEIYDFDDATQVCEATWTGVAVQEPLAGAWTAWAPTADHWIGMRFKGAVAGETLTIYNVTFQVEYE